MVVPAGPIKDMAVPWLFQGIRVEKKSGIAVFETDAAVKKVYFNGGEVIYASSNLNDDRLMEFLLRAGKISAEQRDQLDELIRATGKKEGTVLMERGIITPVDLVDSVNLLVKQIIMDLFSWRNGTFRFTEGPLPQAEIIPLSMTTGSLILEGLGALDWKIIRKVLPQPETVLRTASVPSTLFRIADLSPEQKNIYALINGSRSIEELCSLSVIGDFNTFKAIYALLALRMVETGKGEDVRPPAQEAAPAATPSGAGRARAPEDAQAAPASRDAILKAHAALATQDHYQILGVEKTINATDLKKVYFRLAKLYHPDRHSEPEMSDLTSVLETLFTKISQAYETLSNDFKRNEYERLQAQGAKLSPEVVKARSEKHEKKANAAMQFSNGMAAFKVGNFWGAEDAFRWACQLDPESSQYFHYLGLSLARIPRRSHEAEEKFRRAIELEPENSTYHLELGNLYLKGGLKAKALEHFAMALEYDPRSEAVKKAIQAAGGAAAAEDAKGKGGVFKKIFKDKK